MVLPITLTLAGAATLLHIWLSVRVGRVRGQTKIYVGDGGNEAVVRRMRAHANFHENMPIVVILVGLLELAGADNRFLWGAVILFVLARIAHAFGMDRPSPSRFRMIGATGTGLVLVALAVWALSFAYRAPAPHHDEIQIGPGRSAAVVPPRRS
jgi:uncharacterized membrane protein YecN with MAPEG domain